MALSAFDDKERPPEAQELEAVLGSRSKLWKRLVVYLSEHYPPLEEQWGYSGKNWGWGLRLKQKKRTILHLTPSRKFFYAGFALGEKAVRQALQAELPESVRDVIQNAPRYAEGRGVRLEVRTRADVASVQDLAAIKMST